MTYANNKVIVGNVYAYPGDTTAMPWGQGSRHATHVAGIMAGVEGTYDYTAGPATFPLRFSGIAPGAYVMSYRLWGDTAEFLAAIEDVVADQADALNISLGHSYWLTTDPEHDPVRKALDAAVDAGVVVVGSSGNAGANGESNNTGSWKLSPKVITVANSSHGRIFSNAVSVTGPGTPPVAMLGAPGRGGRGAGTADRVDDLGRVRGGARRQRRKRGRGLYGAGAREHDRQDRAARSRDVHVRRQEGDGHGRRGEGVDRAQQHARRADRDDRAHGPGDSGGHGHAQGRPRARRLGRCERRPDGRHRRAPEAADVRLARRCVRHQ